MNLSRYRILMLAGAALVFAATGLAVAGPNGGTVVGGSATIQGAGTGAVTINQSSQKAIINWNTFDIGNGETTTFNQPNSSSIALNRVVGGLGPTQLLGTLLANGQVFVINGDGILIGPNAVINTAGFLATTNDIRDADFMAGKYNFTIPGNPNASVVNQGTITAASGGFAALVAPGVRNSGTITATLGTVSLAAGNAFTLDFYGDRLITLAVGDQIAGQVIDVATGQPLSALVGNSGKLSANGGRVELTAAAARAVVDSVINNTGVIEANSVGTKNGMIVLGAATAASKPAGAPVQNVKLAGSISAAGKNTGETGGKIKVTGESIALTGATLDASGPAGGGTVMLGIDVPVISQYTTPASTAATVTIDTASTINASTKGPNGNGGSIAIWSDNSTTMNGWLIATGGGSGGAGGQAFILAAQSLAFGGSANLFGTAGNSNSNQSGNNNNLFIASGNDLTITSNPASLATGASYVTVDALQHSLATSNVQISAGIGTISMPGFTPNGNLTVAGSINWSSLSSLNLSANQNITINPGVTIKNTSVQGQNTVPSFCSVNCQNINLQAGQSGTGIGTVVFGDGAKVDVSNSYAYVNIEYNPPGGYANPTSYVGFISVNPDQTYLNAAMLVNSAADLESISSNQTPTILGGSYALVRSIDLSAYPNFIPIGNAATPFIGNFNGNGGNSNGATIGNLTINSASTGPVGLFGQIGAPGDCTGGPCGFGSVSNVTLANVNITANSASAVGALAGVNYGSIWQSSASGTVTGTGSQAVGGLVGINLTGGIGCSVGCNFGGFGGVATSSANVTVTGGNGATVGGLVGSNSGSIWSSYSAGAVAGGTNSRVGGLVGYSNGSIQDTYAIGAARGGGNSTVGGLVGFLVGSTPCDCEGPPPPGGTILTSWASGLVTGGSESRTGGLVGGTSWSTLALASNVVSSYWDTTTTNQQSSAGGSGLSGASPFTQASYLGFDFGGTWFMVDGQTRPFLQSEWSETITNAHQLQLIAMDPTDNNYVIANNINLAPALNNRSDMWSAAGFAPIGSFAGTLTGLGNTISGLTIAPAAPTVNNIGLFGANYGSITNLILSNVTIAANPNVGLTTQSIGALAGQNWGHISNVFVTSTEGFTSTVDGGSQTGLSAGGLVGFNIGTITGASAAVQVTVRDGCFDVDPCGGLNFAGGLVGNNSINLNGFAVRSGGLITMSAASGQVFGGNNTIVGGLVGENTGAITLSYASGTVSVTTSASVNNNFNSSFGGGLVGQNGNGGPPPDNLGTIVASYATGNVTGTGLALAIGGLVGDNSAGSAIVDSQAGGNVTASTDASASQPGNFVNAGGLVGYNQGSIIGTNAPPFTPSLHQVTIGGGLTVSWSGGTEVLSGTNVVSLTHVIPPSFESAPGCSSGVSYSCATGAVSVGALGLGGGLVGNNDGTLFDVVATGPVTGAAGFPSGNNQQRNNGEGQDPTLLGGLSGLNTGAIASGFATGPVGTAGVAYLQVGGLVGQNSGLIGNSSASGAVRAGDNSNAGGLTGGNSLEVSGNGCGSCSTGDGHNNLATVLSSSASGNVTVGAASSAGGLSGTGSGSFSNTTATGNVTGGADSILGGLVGGMGALNGPSFITQSFASGTVTSTGPNSAVGGLVGISGGTIDQSLAAGAVFGTSQSYLGGLVGINVGWIHDSSAVVPVNASGSQNLAGGVAALNFGLIDPTTSSGNVSSGANSVVGGLVGANGAFSNYSAGQLQGSAFPVGTVSSDSIATGSASGGSGSTVGAQVAASYPTSGLPAYSSLLNTCDNAVCAVLLSGQLYDPTAVNVPSTPTTPSIPSAPSTPSSPPSTPAAPPPSTEAQLINNLVQNITLAAVTLGEVVNTQPLNQPPPTQPPRTGPGPAPGPGSGGLPPQFGARFFVPPPLGEVHFVKDEVVLQIPSGVTLAQLQAVMGPLGLSILGSQSMGLIGVTSYRVHIGNGASIAAVIQALARYQIVAGAQANYTYNLVQDHAAADVPELAQDPDLAGRTDGEGDAAQYAIGKLGLIGIHRQLKGDNITVAVIDSQIDVHHPDLEGDIAEEFDAVGEAEKPHSHGTGMAGAIVAHRKLMGVAPDARLYAIHAFSSSAATAESTTFNILKGLEWASDKGVRVINMSFAGPRDPSLERALKAAHDKGIVLVAAAGNAGPKSPPLYPGADPNVIAVTATDVNDKLFPGANRGRYIAVAAPGVDILVPAPEDTYQLTTGTSVASAEVSGLAALLLERNPNLTPEDVRAILMSSARRLGAKDRDDDFGSGLINPSKAIQTAGDLKPVDITGTLQPRPPAGPQKPTPAPAARPAVLSVSHPNGSPRSTR